MRFPRISTDPNRMGGVPSIRDLRFPVATVVGMVADGMGFPIRSRDCERSAGIGGQKCPVHLGLAEPYQITPVVLYS